MLWLSLKHQAPRQDSGKETRVACKRRSIRSPSTWCCGARGCRGCGLCRSCWPDCSEGQLVGAFSPRPSPERWRREYAARVRARAEACGPEALRPRLGPTSRSARSGRRVARLGQSKHLRHQQRSLGLTRQSVFAPSPSAPMVLSSTATVAAFAAGACACCTHRPVLALLALMARLLGGADWYAATFLGPLVAVA